MKPQLMAVAFILSASSINAQSKPVDCQQMRIETSDVTNFWHAWDIWQTRDHADPEKLPGDLQTEYVDKGSAGVAAFTPHRIESAQGLAARILDDPAYYHDVRPVTLAMAAQAPALRAACESFEAIYPEITVPTVYLVIGRRSSGGTSTDAGLIIGAEMYSNSPDARLRPEDFVALVTHEMVHFQQKDNPQEHVDPTLLRQSMIEGAADFIAEHLVGHHGDESAKPYADSHEEELWNRFKAEMRQTTGVDHWLYNSGQVKPPVPPDLGYYMGYKICQAFYQSQTDKASALKKIVAMEDEEAILEQSHYADRFH